jgi:hypothetical protein
VGWCDRRLVGRQLYFYLLYFRTGLQMFPHLVRVNGRLVLVGDGIKAPTKINKRPVHPVADLFPMMTDEELADLAADIKAKGLIHPIVVDKEGVLIDGRNRAKACEIAGIEPTVTVFEGDDPRAFILSMNLKRRHMSAGQQAMAHAMIYPEPEKGGRGKKSRNSTETLGFSAMRLSQARTVLSHSRDVAMEILAGTKFLDKEHAAAKKRTVESDAIRGKKVPALPDIVGSSLDSGVELHALAKLPLESQRSLPEAAKTGENVSAKSTPYPGGPTCWAEEVDLRKGIARLRRDQPQNADAMLICDALERRLKMVELHPDQGRVDREIAAADEPAEPEASAVIPETQVRAEGADGVAGCNREPDPRHHELEATEIRRAAAIPTEIVPEHVARNAAPREETNVDRWVRLWHESERQRQDREKKEANEAWERQLRERNRAAGWP